MDTPTNRAYLRLTASRGEYKGFKATPNGEVLIFQMKNLAGGTWWVEEFQGVIQNGGLNP